MSKQVLVALFTSLVVTILGYFVLYNVFSDDLHHVQSFVSDSLLEQDDMLANTLENNLSLVEAGIVGTASHAIPGVVGIVATKNIKLYFADSRSILPGVLGESEATVGGGSGIYSSESGYVVTNKHVVQDVNASYTIIDNNGDTYDVVNVWFDDILDLAVLKIEEPTNDFEEIPYIAFEKNIAVGSFVLAIGNSLPAVKNIVSFGIVSATNRGFITNQNDNIYAGLIQTDAALYPGNSGGPLINIYGQVIGIITATVDQGQRLGFALPVSQEFIDATLLSIEEYGQITRPYLGISYVDINKGIIEKLDIQDSIEHGVYIESVVDEAAGQLGGLRAGDLILSLNGTAVDTQNSFLYQLYTYMPGDTVRFDVVRNGDRVSFDVPLGLTIAN